MRILHISDTHGTWPIPETDGYDVVVHSGDVLPNFSFGVSVVEVARQPLWIAKHAKDIPEGYRRTPVVVCLGNHDYVDPTPALREAGIDARLVQDEVVEVLGVRFWGHPWTPRFCDWNYNCSLEEMSRRLRPLHAALDDGRVDVLVSHGPMRRVLDRNRQGERCGCPLLRDVLLTCGHLPKAMLCGHIHESAGVKDWARAGPNAARMIVSNAALTQRIVVV